MGQWTCHSKYGMTREEATREAESLNDKDKVVPGFCPLIKGDCVGSVCRMYIKAYPCMLENYIYTEVWIVQGPFCRFDFIGRDFLTSIV